MSEKGVGSGVIERCKKQEKKVESDCEQAGLPS